MASVFGSKEPLPNPRMFSLHDRNRPRMDMVKLLYDIADIVNTR
jgi:hypothetical protein